MPDMEAEHRRIVSALRREWAHAGLDGTDLDSLEATSQIVADVHEWGCRFLEFWQAEKFQWAISAWVNFRNHFVALDETRFPELPSSTALALAAAYPPAVDMVPCVAFGISGTTFTEAMIEARNRTLVELGTLEAASELDPEWKAILGVPDRLAVQPDDLPRIVEAYRSILRHRPAWNNGTVQLDEGFGFGTEATEEQLTDRTGSVEPREQTPGEAKRREIKNRPTAGHPPEEIEVSRSMSPGDWYQKYFGPDAFALIDCSENKLREGLTNNGIRFYGKLTGRFCCELEQLRRKFPNASLPREFLYLSENCPAQDQPRT